MQFVTIASILFGAALAAPAPQADAKVLDTREPKIVVSDITLRGVDRTLSYASIKLEWDGVFVWCVHQPFGLKQECHDIDGHKKGDYNFHMEHRSLRYHNNRADFWVSRKSGGGKEVVSVDMGEISCEVDGKLDDKCTPEHNPAIVHAPATPPQPQARALVPRKHGIKISDITLDISKFDQLSRASIKLEWDGETVWCSHKPGTPLECNIHQVPNNKFKFHVEDGGAGFVKKDSRLTFFVSRENLVHSFPVYVTKCNYRDLGYKARCETDSVSYASTFE